MDTAGEDESEPQARTSTSWPDPPVHGDEGPDINRVVWSQMNATASGLYTVVSAKSGLRAAVFLLIQGLRAAVFLLIQGLRTDVFLLIQGLRTDLACYLISVLVALLHRRYTCCQLLYVIARTRPRKSRKMSPAS